MRFDRYLLAGTALTAVMLSQAAAAQIDKPAVAPVKTAAAEAADDGAETIVVTGSRIRAPNLESAAPVTVVTAEELHQTGNIAVGDLLNDLPQLRSTYSQQNSTRNLGNRGLNLLDLRGLGTARTLVLVNGRRHVGSDVLLNGVSVDINTIPSELIERIDIVTGGASAVYGSDAIGGVVNFILKQDFEGVQARAQGGVSNYGDAENQFGSVIAGKNFADGRGNVAINFEFSHNARFYASNRPNLRQNDGFVVTDTDPAGAVNGSDGVFDRTFFRDIRSTTISLGGQLGFRQPNVSTAPCGVDTVGNSFTCLFLFNPDGSLTPQTGTRVGLGPNGSVIGGNGYSGREGMLLALTPDLKRYSTNLVAHYEVSPALVGFIEAKYVRSDAFGSQSGPFFSQGQTLSDSITGTGLVDRSYSTTGTTLNREGIRIDNPYLSAASRATISAQLTASITAGVNPNTGTAYGTTAAGLANQAASLAQVAAGTYRFSLRRNYLDLGIRDEKFRRETYRIVAGVRGDFNDDWNYEISLNYGEHKERNEIQGNINRQRFLLATDTTLNSAGQIVCRSQVDSRYAGTDRAGNPAVLAADVAACTPLNPFGVGNISNAAKQYLLINTLATGKITQFDATAYVAGDSSQLFELPGGPVAFSIGAEYRRETLRYDLDDTTQAGYAFYNAIPSFTSPSFGVKEAFGEVRVPLLKDRPFFEELTLKGSGRVSDYKGSTGTVYTYGGEGIWSPVRDITFRGAYNRAVRAPALSDLYSAQGQNFAPAPSDPCSARNLATGSATRLANCTAAGRPSTYDFVYTSSLEIRSGGNPSLTEETSDSYTFGGYIQPRFIPGLSVSADYYDITVKNVITSIGSAQTILNLCYDSPTLNNPFCPLFQRAGASGGPAGEIPFQVLSGSLLQSTANFAKLKVRGVDSQLNYSHTFDLGTLTVNSVWTHVIKTESYTNPQDPTFKDVFKSELNDPDDQVNVSVNFKRNKLSVGYQLRWIDHMYVNTYEDYNSVNGLPPQNTDFAPIKKYPAVFYHDINASYDVKKNINLYGGIDNFTNRKPPFGLTGIGAGSGIYDNRGQFFYGGVKVSF